MQYDLDQINWPKLAKQKVSLLNVIHELQLDECDAPTEDGETTICHLDGILSLIDSLQDAAAVTFPPHQEI